MKYVSLSVALGAIALLLNSCQKEQGQESRPAPNEERVTGALLLSKEEYNRLPQMTIEDLRKAHGKTKIELTTLPGTVTLPCAPIGNQGGEGSCTAWATAYAGASSLEYQISGNAFSISRRSPEFVYNQTKASSNCQNGAYITSALNLIKNKGVCSWTQMPYTDAGCALQPNASQLSAASAHKFNWGTLDNTNLNTVKTALYWKHPVIIAIDVDQSFMALNSTNNLWSAHGGAYKGGHALAVVGYDDTRKAFKIQNSWGTGWGAAGFCWISYSFFTNATSAGAVEECYVMLNI